jgi:hypothetical protein
MTGQACWPVSCPTGKPFPRKRMARSRRPELEKDNPVAPEAYVSRRRKAEARSDDHTDMVDTLTKLIDAAEQFVNRAPRLKRNAVEHQALLDAITHAQLILSVRRMSSKPRPT